MTKTTIHMESSVPPPPPDSPCAWCKAEVPDEWKHFRNRRYCNVKLGEHELSCYDRAVADYAELHPMSQDDWDEAGYVHMQESPYPDGKHRGHTITLGEYRRLTDAKKPTSGG